MVSVHVSVLLHEVVSAFLGLNKDKGNGEIWYIDGTLGGAGHAIAIAGALKGDLNIMGFDMDERAIENAKNILSTNTKKLILKKDNFRNLGKILTENNISNVDFILLDLGISSDELENSGKGFSFMKDEPLYMTMGNPESYPFTANDIVNNWKEEDIANVIYAYGEERFARRIARTIVNYRERKRIETSSELAEIVKSSLPLFYKRSKIHPATKTFQALRIAVNDELKALTEALEVGYRFLRKGGRMTVISFHSLEDRIVKDFYKKQALNGANIITKKPIRPGVEEIALNPRSRSAKMRIIEKIL